ncbi:hypothetical protein LTR66_005869 [Elasticomyces elasticus]|nr:hypothetical protein LTR28_004066 [Elasticomyces elasticus]KAK4994008.1 hypothetical protein LTR66_005869 [Elasticomyces elasticus]
MTSRNLNRTWRDIVFTQYAADYEADVVFPIRYIISTPQWKQDILINITKKTEVDTFRQSIFTFFRALHTSDDPTYEDEHISMLAKTPLLKLLPLLLLATIVNSWDFVVYPDSSCESTPSGAPSGTDDGNCETTPANHRGFEISNIGNCILYLYSSLDDCNNDNFEQVYDFGDEDDCIAPDFTWDAYKVEDC